MANPHTGLTVIYPVPHELERNDQGIPVCGPNTAKACDEAITEARAQGFENCVILFTATNDSVLWDGQKMGLIMKRYVEAQEPSIQTQFLEARSFNTFSEGDAIAKFLGLRIKHIDATDKLVLIVKDWHANRLNLIVGIVFRKNRLKVPYEIKRHVAPGESRHRMLEPLKMILVLVRGLFYEPQP